jgi:hypothetical protein
MKARSISEISGIAAKDSTAGFELGLAGLQTNRDFRCFYAPCRAVARPENQRESVVFLFDRKFTQHVLKAELDQFPI